MSSTHDEFVSSVSDAQPILTPINVIKSVPHRRRKPIGPKLRIDGEESDNEVDSVLSGDKTYPRINQK